jgi:hypothetical protein
MSLKKELLDDWKTPPKLLWQAEAIGDGYASLVVATGVVYTMGNHGDRMDVDTLLSFGISAI